MITNDVSGSTDGSFQQKLSTKYVGRIPFSQTYTYEASANQKGLYSKYLNGAKALLQLPTVIVDAQKDASGKYATIVEFTCKSVLGVPTTELRISSRSKTMDDATLAKLKQAALTAGVPSHIVDGLKTNDYSKCQ